MDEKKRACFQNFVRKLCVPCVEAFLTDKRDGDELALTKHLQEFVYKPAKASSTDVFLFSEDKALAAFQKHFILHHSLYILQDRFDEQGKHSLTIDMHRFFLIDKQLSKSKEHARAVDDTHATRIKSYYLEPDNFLSATAQTARSLFADFSAYFYDVDKRQQALVTLGLKSDASFKEVQLAYRQKINQAHPDKGGCAENFDAVMKAYAILKRFK